MRRALWIAAGVLGALLVGVGLWWLFGTLTQKGATNESSQLPTVQSTDLTAEKNPTVDIRDLSFTPANIKVKVGAKVTWKNADGVGHSIVADDESNTGGLPVSPQTIGKNGVITVTFKTVGKFRYHCGVHSFMHGSVEVVE